MLIVGKSFQANQINMKVFILGASSDIGVEVCRIFLSNGWSVLAHYRNMRKELQSLSSDYQNSIEFLKMNFGDTKTTEKVLIDFRNKYLDCDSFINCAGAFS